VCRPFGAKTKNIWTDTRDFRPGQAVIRGEKSVSTFLWRRALYRITQPPERRHVRTYSRSPQPPLPQTRDVAQRVRRRLAVAVRRRRRSGVYSDFGATRGAGSRSVSTGLAG